MWVCVGDKRLLSTETVETVERENGTYLLTLDPEDESVLVA